MFDTSAVLLDMDGTLVDSDAAVDRAWTIWAGEYGVEPAAALAISAGVPAETTVRRLLPGLDDARAAAAAARQLALQYDDLADVVPLPGAHELITTLDRRGLRWAVVTSADTRLAHARLAAADIDPPVLVTADDVVDGKPHPEPYLTAAERLGVPASRCLVVEDAVGMRVAALRGLDGDVRLRDLAELAHLLRRAA